MKITLIVDAPYQNNQIFNLYNEIINRDDCQRQWIYLKKRLCNLGIEIDTVDITDVKDADLVVFINIPHKSNPYLSKAISLKKKCYVVINELAIIHTPNNNYEMHKYFNKIFTYQEDLVDNKKIFKVNYSFDFQNELEKFDKNSKSKNRLCTMIAGNKKLNHPNELYSERVKTIRWFEKNHLLDFDLYGIGWDKSNYFKKLLSIKYKSYKGCVKCKREILSKYKFNFCYENARDITGWVTEKIFDSFFASSVPIYWGWDGIDNFVDPGLYINRKNFSSNHDLYNYIINVHEAEYNEYLNNIYNFLSKVSKDDSYEFGIPYFIKTIETEIKKDFFNG